jgi:hypothetical protein
MIDFLTGLGPLAAFGLVSAALSCIAFLPYIADTLRGHTRPQRASWLIWSVLGSIAVFSQLYEGATHSLMFAAAQVSGTIIVFLLSIRRGTGSFVNKADAMVLVAASVGLVAWYMTSSSVYALMISISISAIGGAVTAFKAYKQPASETMTTWGLSLVASVLAVLAVGRMDPILLAYPMYLLVLNGAIVLAMIAGRMRDARVVDTTASVVLMGEDFAIQPVFKTERALPRVEGFPEVEPPASIQMPARRKRVMDMQKIRAGAKARLRA